MKVPPKSQGGAQKHPPFKASMKAAKLHPVVVVHHHRGVSEESTTLTGIQHGPKYQPNNRRQRHENIGAIF